MSGNHLDGGVLQKAWMQATSLALQTVQKSPFSRHPKPFEKK